MSFEDLDFDTGSDEEPGGPEESNNKTFLIIAGVLGSLALLALIGIVVYVLVLLPRTKQAQVNNRAAIDAQNTQVAAMVEKTATQAAHEAIIAAYTKTPTNTPEAPAEPSVTPTSVVVIPTTAVVAFTNTPNSQTATAMSLFATLDANATRLASTFTAQPTLTRSIPSTGFADEVGLPALFGMALLFIAIIFLARRLRSA